jgi:DNA-binding transcriptional ArsR family regulator
MANDQDLEQLTAVFRLLSDKTRLNILMLLSDGSATSQASAKR